MFLITPFQINSMMVKNKKKMAEIIRMTFDEFFGTIKVNENNVKATPNNVAPFIVCWSVKSSNNLPILINHQQFMTMGRHYLSFPVDLEVSDKS